MNKKLIFVLSIVMCAFLLFSDLEARGGRGGGGGGRGGGSRGGGSRGGGGAGRGSAARSAASRSGRSVQRSPSMSRAAHSRPSIQQPAMRQARQANIPPRTNRPSSMPSRPQARPANRTPSRPSTANRARTRNDIQNFLQDSPASRPIDRSSVNRAANAIRQGQSSIPGSRPNVSNIPGSRPNLTSIPGNRHSFGQNVRNDINRNRPSNRDWFNNNFWDRHNLRPDYIGNNRNWWGLATAAGVASWLDWNDGPLYYDNYYGDSGYYWGASDSSYSVEPSTTSPQAVVNYPRQTQTIPVESTTTVQGNDDWMPLGVFSLVKEGDSKVTPNIYLQLALNRQGILAGTYYNVTTDQAYETDGIVDKDSQRAVWKIADKENSPIIETGIYNLTQSEVPVRVHFTDGRTQQMMLVRLEE